MAGDRGTGNLSRKGGRKQTKPDYVGLQLEGVALATESGLLQLNGANVTVR